MFDPERVLGQMLGGALGGAFGGSGKKKRKGGFGGMSTGTKAQLGVGLLGIAFAAYEHYRQQRGGFGAGAPAGSVPPPPPQTGSMPPPPPSGAAGTPPPPPPASTHADAKLVMQAMIAAAAADGRIDDAERTRILERAVAAGIDAAGRQFLEAELAAPKSVEGIASATRAALAPDVYGASVLAISLDTPEERAYLDSLARALGLSDAQRAEIHSRLG
jgi:uncharacterized membrane protein YebE (DUF533 family)